MRRERGGFGPAGAVAHELSQIPATMRRQGISFSAERGRLRFQIERDGSQLIRVGAAATPGSVRD